MRAVGVLRRRAVGRRATRVAAVSTSTARVAALAATAAGFGLRTLAMPDDRVVMDDDAAPGTELAGLTERLDQPETELLAGHLHETEARDLCDLVFRTVAAEALDESTQHEVAIGLEHHVDEVDDDNPADVAKSKLAHDLFRGLEVVLGDGLFEISTGSDELAGVDVDDRHGLRAVDHERATGWQPDLAVQRLFDLLRDAVLVEGVDGALVGLQTVDEIRGNLLEVGRNRTQGILAFDDEFVEVLVEDIAHDLDE